MSEFNVDEYEAKINELNRQLLEGTITNKEIQTQITKYFGEDNLAFRLKNRLMGMVNGEISAKAKENLSDREYFSKRADIENQIIQSNFPHAFFQESTIEEIEALNPTLIDEKTLMLVIIQSLRTFIDLKQEDNPKCEMLHVHYLLLNKQLSSEIPDYPEGDGYYEYLNERSQRAKIAEGKQNGTMCPYCRETSHIQRYGSGKRKCTSCNHYWRVSS